ncbi:TetR/AcrR family transcriptional regulator [Martelella mangrovi]|uniref:AcrR family transcriptional regulator n=1 Tax=Martelella mangrovi TaxID=1397477 RepID=A0ABV2IHR0_9HYPH
MNSPTSGSLEPRKAPVQKRSKATVEAILEATVQVLLRDGAEKLTTRRIAERAGVSVGTLYQYAPSKEALLYALVSRHLDLTASAVEQACRTSHGRTLMQCSDAFVTAYVDAKAADPEVSRALYHATSRFDMTELVDAAFGRLYNAAHALLDGANDAVIKDIDHVVFSWVAIVAGGTRQIIEGADTVERFPAFRCQLVKICRAYLETVRIRE